MAVRAHLRLVQDGVGVDIVLRECGHGLHVQNGRVSLDVRGTQLWLRNKLVENKNIGGRKGVDWTAKLLALLLVHGSDLHGCDGEGSPSRAILCARSERGRGDERGQLLTLYPACSSMHARAGRWVARVEAQGRSTPKGRRGRTAGRAAVGVGQRGSDLSFCRSAASSEQRTRVTGIQLGGNLRRMHARARRRLSPLLGPPLRSDPQLPRSERREGAALIVGVSQDSTGRTSHAALRTAPYTVVKAEAKIGK